jgi:hypothetical protein
MGFEQNHPSPAHSPGTTTQLLSVHTNIDLNNNNNNSKKSWNSLMRRTNSPSIADSIRTWRPATSRCHCKLSIRPMSSAGVSDPIDIPTVVHYAHQYGDFAKAHDDFEAVKDLWTPQMFGQVLNLIQEANCMNMDMALRTFHQAIRNNGLWTNWIESASSYPRFEAILLEELAAVIENLSPKYLKDIKIDHLLKIFPSSDGKQDVQLHGKKRKLKRQVLKWCETQSEDVLDLEWEKINALKWRLQSVIDHKDKEMEERQKQKLSYQHNWRSNSASPINRSGTGIHTFATGFQNHIQSENGATNQPANQKPRFSLSISDKNNWPSLQSNWNSTAPHESRLILGM